MIVEGFTERTLEDLIPEIQVGPDGQLEVLLQDLQSRRVDLAYYQDPHGLSSINVV